MAYSETLKYFANEKGSQEYNGGNLECKGSGAGGFPPHFFLPPPPPLRSQERVILCTLLVNQNKEFRLIFPSQKIINVNSVLCKTIHASFSFVALLTRNTVYRCMISTITLNKAYFLHLLLIINKQFLFFLITILPHF